MPRIYSNTLVVGVFWNYPSIFLTGLWGRYAVLGLTLDSQDCIGLRQQYWSALATAPAETSAEAKEASIIASSSSH